MRFVNPRNDVAFKKIFGDENKKEILISFLNGLLDLTSTPKEIVEVTLLNPYQVPKLEGSKQTILDIRARDKRNICYIVEMQMFHSQAFEKRVLSYAAKAYSEQLERGEDYPRLNQVIFIGILDFVLFPREERYQTRHLVMEEKSGEHYLKDLEFDFVELPKFTKALAELSGIKEKWLYFMKHAEELETVPGELREPSELAEAFESASRMTWNKEELNVYEVRGIYIQDERGRIELARAEARVEGRAEGQSEERMRIAREMRTQGISLDVIQKVTGVPIQNIDRPD